MTLSILFAANQEQFPAWQQALSREFLNRNLDVKILVKTNDPSSIDYIAYSRDGNISDFTHYSNLKAVFSLWAGVESLMGNHTINCPITRMVEPGMTESMTEWVTGQVLRHHLGLDQIVQMQDGIWRHHLTPPLARDRTITILGLGKLGQACAKALNTLKFNVIGWSRSAKSIKCIDCRHGQDGLYSSIAQGEIIVVLLPHTLQTENLIDEELLAKFRFGSVIINSGRGAIINEEALVTALDSGQIAHATLDVFCEEPLPSNHPFWNHKAVTVSPHIAADTKINSAAAVVAENVKRNENGEPLLYLCNVNLGY